MSWLLAYDIASPRRWRKVHARVSDIGHRLQFSLWWLPIPDREMNALLADLADVIEPAEDDLRAWPFPNDAWCRLYGPPPWGEGVQDPFSRRFAPHWLGVDPSDDPA